MPYIPAHGAELIGKIVSQGPRDTVAITIIYLLTEYGVLRSCFHKRKQFDRHPRPGVISCGSFDPGTLGLDHVPEGPSWGFLYSVFPYMPVISERKTPMYETGVTESTLEPSRAFVPLYDVLCNYRQKWTWTPEADIEGHVTDPAKWIQRLPSCRVSYTDRALIIIFLHHQVHLKMSPDLNSLPPSRSSSISSSAQARNMAATPGNVPPANPSASPRPSRGSSIGRLSVSERRRSAAGINLNLNDMQANSEAPVDHRSSIGHAFRTASPSSHGGSPVFATADPHHQRAPSLGELHQELEQEQEAQVNRLLQMIRSQQAQLHQYQQNQPQQNPQSSAAIDDTTPSSERSAFFPPGPPPPAGNRLSISSSFSNRRPSRSESQATSPNLRPLDSRGPEGVEPFPGLRDNLSRRGSRDESAFYQAEASSLGRENLLLRQRIRELGKPTLFRSRCNLKENSTPGSGMARTHMLTIPHRETNWRIDDFASTIDGCIGWASGSRGRGPACRGVDARR
ncbi:unnamed protein product [Penicillium salamii]|uniref:Uncharacterized protein n=1 Tax=Penicillium salamii TaxID=1612424 RepID=A0A9W4ISN6_9EURO|nr:unnamed protein product [Penicillium salamii]CAG8012526.1 unnamed protein product [Penicillium salamii]CAG8019816.1 unnamed protein product [Penicillium salamii]CAG8062256.1 unnamed protein product [Penicillium salamii]CAG8152016.1 unnamed protein product [Penicillium salamii]